jgi:hypothetical protein
VEKLSTKKASANEEAAMDIDGEDQEEDETAAPTSSKMIGRVFVAVESGPNVSEKEQGRQIWMWKAEAGVGSENYVPGKPHGSKTVRWMTVIYKQHKKS